MTPDPPRSGLEAFVRAFETVARPKDAAGAHLRRKPTSAERAEMDARAWPSLDEAVALSEAAGAFEPPYRYMRARLAHETGRLEAAAADWERLIAVIDAPKPGARLIDDAAALVLILAAAMEAALDRPAEALLARGAAFLEQAARRLFGDGPRHRGVRVWEKTIEAVREDGASAELPSVDWVTIE